MLRPWNLGRRLPRWWKPWGLSSLLVCWLSLSLLLSGCDQRTVASPPPLLNAPSSPVIQGKLSEVATPLLIQQLAAELDAYQPQVKILSPQPEQVLKDTTVAVKLSVEDLPLFQNPDLEMGPHLHLILDNQPYQAIYDVNEPIILSDVAPGTHTLRAFPVRPWHESFKNEGAYAQTTFHVLTPSAENHPDPQLPLLTYSRPKGSYGAEPILLDFYLTNAPLHLVAQEDEQDAIADWRIRVTINNESFLLDHWQSIYLKGFEKGKNWVKLEFIDEQGNSVANTFNNTVRVIDYQPNGQDSLSRLVRGDIPLAIAKSIVKEQTILPVSEEPSVEPVVSPLESEPLSLEESSASPDPGLDAPAFTTDSVDPAIESNSSDVNVTAVPSSESSVNKPLPTPEVETPLTPPDSDQSDQAVELVLPEMSADPVPPVQESPALHKPETAQPTAIAPDSLSPNPSED